MQTPPVLRLSPEAFRAVAHEKGWTYAALAERWGLSAVWVSNLARNPDRSPHYDDALLNLPNRQFLAQETARRRRMVARMLERYQARKGQRPLVAAPADPFVAGTILTAVIDVGSIAEEGSRAIVVRAQGTGDLKQYLVLLANGAFDWFSPRDLPYFFAETGLRDPNFERYSTVTEENLLTLLDDGFFTFD